MKKPDYTITLWGYIVLHIFWICIALIITMGCHHYIFDIFVWYALGAYTPVYLLPLLNPPLVPTWYRTRHVFQELF